MNDLIILDRDKVGQGKLFLTQQGKEELPHKCKRCKRQLRSMKSRLLGYGPVCFQKLDAEQAAAAEQRLQGQEVAA